MQTKDNKTAITGCNKTEFNDAISNCGLVKPRWLVWVCVNIEWAFQVFCASNFWIDVIYVILIRKLLDWSANTQLLVYFSSS